MPGSILQSFGLNGANLLDWFDFSILQAETLLAANNMSHFQDLFLLLRQVLAHLRTLKEALGSPGSVWVHLKGLREPSSYHNWYRIVMEIHA
jgi:hypothetical protein